jgi:hypothetical protein
MRVLIGGAALKTSIKIARNGQNDQILHQAQGTLVVVQHNGVPARQLYPTKPENTIMTNPSVMSFREYATCFAKVRTTCLLMAMNAFYRHRTIKCVCKGGRWWWD